MSLRMELLAGYACGQKCSFCMESSRMDEFARSPVSLEEIVRALATQRRRGAASVSFCGAGEPTLHPKLPQALKAAKALGYETEVISNGSRLASAAYARLLLPRLDRLWLSLHGPDAASHDRLAGRRGAFAGLLKAFANARAAGGPAVGAVTVVTRGGAARAAETVALALREGARDVRLTQVVPMGRAEKDYARLAVPYAWWRRELPGLDALARRAGARLSCAGLPLCALGPRRGLSWEGGLDRTVSVDRAWSGGRAILRAEELLPRAEAAASRVKPAACASCAAREDCIGVPAAHAAAHGEADLVPFPDGRARAERHEQGDGVEKILRVAHACNQRCSFCFVPVDGWKAGLGEIERELDRLAPELAGGGTLTLSGGEPLVHPRLFDMLEAARRRGIARFTLQTNGVGLAKAGALERLSRLGVSGFDVSFHAHEAPLYDRLTGTRRQHARAVEGLTRALALNRGYVSANIVINALNYRKLPSWAAYLGRLARRAGRDAREPLRVGFTMLNGIGLDRTPELAVDLDRVRPYLRRAAARAAREGLIVQRSCGESDLPPCLAADPDAFVAESPLPQGRVRYAEDFSFRDAAGGRAKRPACRECPYDSRCLGVPAEYARRFGLGALHA